MYRSEALLSTLVVPMTLLLILRFIIPIPLQNSSINVQASSGKLPRYDYAAFDSGGKILDTSKSVRGSKGLLTDNKDKYLLVPCKDSEKWVEISLSEDILIDSIQIVQEELYSSWFKDFEIYGATEYPPQTWKSLGRFTLKHNLKTQVFKINPSWVRYFKIAMLTHYGSEYYCTMSQLSVYGSTMLQSFHEDYQQKREQATEKLKRILKSAESSNTSYPTPSRRSADIDKGYQVLQKIWDLMDIENSNMVTKEKILDFREFLTGNGTLREWVPQPQWSFVPYSMETQHDTYSSNFLFKTLAEQITQTEMKMKITEKYIDLFVDLADKTQSIIEKLDQDIAMLDSKQTNLRSKIEEFSQTLVDHDMLDERVMDLNQKIDRLRGQVTYLETENRYYESSIDSLTFKVYLSLIGLVILILFIAAKYLLDSSYKPSGKSSKHVHIQRQSSDKSAYHTTTHKNAKIRKSSSIDLECELRFLNNVTSHKRGKKKTLTRF
jgi:hypothetical protein